MVQHLIRLQNETAQKNRRNEEIMQQLIASIFKLQSAFDQQTIRNEKQALKLQDENARLAALVNAHEKKLPARPEHFAAEDREKKDSNDLASDDENNHRHSTSDIHNDNSAHSDLDAINSDGGEPGEAQAEKGVRRDPHPPTIILDLKFFGIIGFLIKWLAVAFF